MSSLQRRGVCFIFFSATFICCKFLPTHCLGMPYGDLYSLNFKFFLLICKKSLNINLNKYKWYLSWQVYLMTSLFFYMLHLHFHDNYLYNIKKNNHLSTKLISIIFNVHVPIYNVVYNQNYVYLHFKKKEKHNKWIYMHNSIISDCYQLKK